MTSDTLETIFEQFLKERTYLKGRSQNLKFYRSSFRAYQSFSGSATLPTKADLNAFVVGLQGAGISTASCNNYIRGMNCFVSWMFENELIGERLKLQQLKGGVEGDDQYFRHPGKGSASGFVRVHICRGSLQSLTNAHPAHTLPASSRISAVEGSVGLTVTGMSSLSTAEELGRKIRLLIVQAGNRNFRSRRF